MTGSGALVFDATAATFNTDVVERSVKVPVLLDFWADWCGPCKTLTPVLEKVAAEYGGAFVLGKVDTEKEPELAQAFQIQGIPFVCLLSGGRPVDAFQGAIPEPELRAFLSRAGIEPLASAETDADEDSPAYRLVVAKRAVLAADVGAVRENLDAIDDEADEARERDRVREGLTLFEATLDANASPAAAHLLRAREVIQQGHVTPAMEELLQSIEADRAFADGLARKAMLLCFALIGEDSDECSDVRRRMATLLY